MVDIDFRLLAYLVWGIGTTLIYFVVMDRRYRAYLRRPDARARRELVVCIGLFITALMANLAVLMVLFGTPGTGLRGFFIATSLGAFFAVGIVMLTDRRAEE